MYYINTEDLAMNALIESVEKTGYRKISFSQINKYGEAIIGELAKNGIDAILIYNKNSVDEFFSNCFNFLTIDNTNNLSITLNDNVSSDFLRKKFRICLSPELLQAFTSSDAINTIIKR